MSSPRYRVIESIAMTSAPSRSARATPTAVLPEAVGPVRNRARWNGFPSPLTSKLPDPSPAQEHRQKSILADLQDRPMERRGQRRRGSRPFDGSRGQHHLGGDPQNGPEREQTAAG